MIKINEKLYEDFHKETGLQSSIINENNFTYKIITKFINKYLDPRKSVLDIGCGAGTLSLYAASKGCKVLGIDISINAIEVCRRSAKQLGPETNAKFMVMKFPEQVPNGKFDLILLIEVIEHLKDDDLALRKIYSLLNKNGIVILSTPSKNAPLYKLGLAKEFDRRVGHLRRYTVDQLVSMSNKVGFKVIKIKKTEGIIRNFLFLNPIAGKFIRYIKFFIVDIIFFLDKVSLKLFGESDIFLILKKP